MNYSVRYHPEAEAELIEAATYLNKETAGLGNLFLDDLQQTLDLIIDTPKISPVIEEKVRRKLFLKFPYSLIYSLVNLEMRILAVAHQRRRPFYWQDRE